MKAKRTNFVNLLYNMLHWFYVDILAFLSFNIMLGFSKDLNPDIADGLYLAKEFAVNIPAFIIGVLVLLSGYFFIWKLWLLEDRDNFKESKKVWKVLSVVVEILTLIAIFLIFFLVMVMSLGWGYFTASSHWVDYSIVVFIILLAVMPVVLIKKKKTEK